MSSKFASPLAAMFRFTGDRTALTAAMIVVTAFGAWQILPNLSEPSLSHAEAVRVRFHLNPLTEGGRRLPPLQGALLATIHHFVPGREWALRLPAAMAVLACAVLLMRQARTMIDAKSALITGLIVVSHPLLMAHAREMKEFTLEAMFVAGVFCAGWRAFESPSRSRLLAFLGVGLLGLGFTFTSSLALVAWWPILALGVVRHAEQVREARVNFAAMSLVLLAAGVAWFSWLANFDERETYVNYYYTQIEPSWPAAYSLSVFSVWLIEKLYGTLLYTLGVTPVWEPLKGLLGSFGLLAMVAGIAKCSRRAPSLVVAAALLMLLTIIAAASRHWPIGNVRQVTFLVPVVALLVGLGVSDLARRVGWRSPVSWLILTVCVLVPAGRAAKASMQSTPCFEHIRPVVAYVSENARPGDAIVVYYGAADAFQYYWRRSDCTIVEQPRSDRDRPDLFLGRVSRALATHQRAWFVSAHDWKTERKDWMALLAAEFQEVDAFATIDANAQLLQVRVPESAGTGSHETMSAQGRSSRS